MVTMATPPCAACRATGNPTPTTPEGQGGPRGVSSPSRLDTRVLSKKVSALTSKNSRFTPKGPEWPRYWKENQL